MGTQSVWSVNEVGEIVTAVGRLFQGLLTRCRVKRIGGTSCTITPHSFTASTGTSVEIALGSSAVNGTETSVANENTAPSGPTFSAPASEGAALSIGDIPAGQHKAVWLKRIVNTGAAAYNNDTATLTVKCDTAA